MIIYAGLIQNKLFDGIVMHIDRLDAQCRGKNVSCQGFFQSVKTKSTKIFIANYTVIMKEDIFKKLTLAIKINRCRSKENLDTCEEFMNQPNIDYCKAIDPKNFIASKSPFFVPLEPTPKCPFNKGNYHAYNFTFDLAPFIFFNLEGCYWKVTVEVFSADKHKLTFCMHFDGYITRSKSKTN